MPRHCGCRRQGQSGGKSGARIGRPRVPAEQQTGVGIIIRPHPPGGALLAGWTDQIEIATQRVVSLLSFQEAIGEQSTVNVVADKRAVIADGSTKRARGGKKPRGSSALIA
jgi:hypothetical protein